MKRRHVPQSMTVITKSVIDMTPAQEVTDLLKKNSSVSIIQYIRDYLLVLVYVVSGHRQVA
ncbi:hypothetical protein [Pedobacter sp. NJ-S-72]